MLYGYCSIDNCKNIAANPISSKSLPYQDICLEHIKDNADFRVVALHQIRHDKRAFDTIRSMMHAYANALNRDDFDRISAEAYKEIKLPIEELCDYCDERVIQEEIGHNESLLTEEQKAARDEARRQFRKQN